jgi:hypothetical protein
MLLIYIALCLGFLILSKDIYLSGYKVLLNPIFWAALISIFYFLIPSLFVNEIDYYFKWNFNPNSILKSHVLVSIYMVYLYALLWLFSSKRIVINDEYVCWSPSILIKIIWYFISFYLIYVVYITYVIGGFLNSFQYDGVQDDVFKLKNIAYLLLFISIYLFWATKKYIYFIPNVFIVILDVTAGSRTVALIALMPIIISFCIYQRKLYIIPGAFIVIGMSVLGALRADSGIIGVPWHINGMGEFREVYLTLPLYIGNRDYVGLEGLSNALSALSLGVLQPIRSLILESNTFSGAYLAADIGRGYGLGANLLIDGLYYGYIGLILTLLIFSSILILSYKMISNFKLVHSIYLITLFVIILRLIIREGLYINMGLMVLVLTLYWLPFYYISRLRITKSKVAHEK